MTWLRVDDKSAFHQKVLRAGNEAWGALVRAGAQSAGEGTDGRVSRELLLTIAPMRVWKRAMIAGLLEAIPGSADFQIHDYLQWNDSASEIEAKAAARRKKSENAAQARWGARGRVRSQEQSDQAADAVLGALLNDAPSMPRALPQAHTSECPIPIHTNPDPEDVGAEDLRGPGAVDGEAHHHHQALSTEWLLAELRQRPALTSACHRPFAEALAGLLVSKPRPVELVRQALTEVAVDAAGQGLTGEALQRKVRSYVLHAKSERERLGGPRRAGDADRAKDYANRAWRTAKEPEPDRSF